MKQGMPKAHRIDLSTAREGQLYTVRGKIIRVADASDASALINIALHENIPDRFEALQKTGKVRDDDGFDVFYVKNAAQAGKWVKIIVSEGAYDVETPVTNQIDSITNPVSVQNTTATPLNITNVFNTITNSAATTFAVGSGATTQIFLAPFTGGIVENYGPSTVYLGTSSTVATLQANGIKILPGETASFIGNYASMRATTLAGTANLRTWKIT